MSNRRAARVHFVNLVLVDAAYGAALAALLVEETSSS